CARDDSNYLARFDVW
nr:immunoglobulin heavy chain junction region [Macaca mulatta]MOV49064.1 immunoglobulin heavy chain junction region [Macaca mulatta]MOV49140.1 immunoglobulin heavy chain junction region [Macaca mulatta]MOV49229.1 immunoglobulin heavy chain junction region [Macaca mulatta]MOV49375.1 immunoglobulin heavy chain junction region [Macaca mulatta]